MLKPLLLALLVGPLLAVHTTNAQTLLNGGLETWETRKGKELPANWLTLYDLEDNATAPFPAGLVTKSTDKRSGNFAAQVNSLTITNPLGSVTLSGILFLGSKIGADANLPGGLPVTGRPSQLQFYYKLSGTTLAEDPAEVEVKLTRTVNRVRETIGEGTLSLAAGATTYTLGTIQLRYPSTTVPDSIHVEFYSGTGVGSSLSIDDVSLLGIPTPTRAAQADQALVSVFPNPSASGLFTLTAPTKEVATAPFRITDAAGRLVLSGQASTGSRTIDLQHQPSGVYLLRLATPAGALVRRLLIL